MSTQPPAPSPEAPLPPAERAAWIAWASLACLPAAELHRLRSRFGSLAAAWSASDDALRHAGVAPAAVTAITTRRPTVAINTVIPRLTAAGCRVVTLGDPEYPLLLRRLHDPPLVLFYRGQLPTAAPAVAVVGTRQASDYGRQIAWQFGRDLARAGLTIVSGLALGIDTEAHQAALAVERPTVAVLGGGVDPSTVYPPANRALAETILRHGGCVVAEYPPQTPPLPFRFPERNRLIAGLSLGTLVVEAPFKSGALITAKIAAEENREVWVVPGRLTDPTSAGSNALLAQGAMLVESVADIIASLGQALPSPARAPTPRDESAPEGMILAGLNEPSTREDVHQRTRLPAAVISAALTRLEILGEIRRLPSGKFFRTK